MAKSCPISFERVDATTIRIISALVVSILVAQLFFSSPLPLVVLVIDFSIRIFFNRAYSPLYQTAKRLQSVLRLQNRYEDAAAKRLASYFGLFFALALVPLLLLHFMTLFYAVTALFASCALLEAGFGFCVGCKIYYLWRMLFR